MTNHLCEKCGVCMIAGFVGRSTKNPNICEDCVIEGKEKSEIENLHSLVRELAGALDTLWRATSPCEMREMGKETVTKIENVLSRVPEELRGKG